MTVLRTDAWFILEPQRRGYDGDLLGIEITKMLKNKPRLGVREVGVHVILEVDSAIFVSPEPEVTVRINDKRAIVMPELNVAVESEPTEGATDATPETEESAT